MPIFGGGGVAGITSIVFGAGLNGGTVTSTGTVSLATPVQQTINATTTAAITPLALPVSSALVNVGSTVVTLDINAGFVGQEIYLRIKQNGSTAHAVTLGTTFIDGLDITSFTSTPSAVADDLVRVIALSASQWALAAINHGFTI